MKITKYYDLTVKDLKSGDVFKFLNIHKDKIWMKTQNNLAYLLVNLENGEFFQFKQGFEDENEPVKLLSAELIVYGEKNNGD